MDELNSTDRAEQHAKRGRGARYLFIVVFVMGLCSITVLKYLGFSQAIVTLVPCLILVAYALTISSIAFFRMPEDRAGDSCYYLGFLFTLISLGLALYQFSAGDAEIDRLISNFGIA